MLHGRCACPLKLIVKIKSLSPIKFPNDGGNSLVQFPICKDFKSFISCKILGNFLSLSQSTRLKDVRDFIVRQLGRVSSLWQPPRSNTLSLSRCPMESSISTKFRHHLRFNFVMFGVVDKSGIFLINLHSLKSTYVRDAQICRKFFFLKVRTWFTL